MKTLTGETVNYKPDPHTVIRKFYVYNYFCLKGLCFLAWVSSTKSIWTVCPKCGESKDVVYRF
jgi:hypothetical protein